MHRSELGNGSPAVAAPIAALVAVGKAYPEGAGKRVIYRGLDAEFPRGRISVVQGRSGTGKTTLLNLLCGIDTPDCGEVLLDGLAIGALPERERTLVRRARIGFVFQFFNLVPTLSVLENVRLPLELQGVGVRPASRRAREWLGRVGLADRAGTYPDRLSGGEQQRVAVVRALVHEPELVLADEPTGNLDAQTAAEVLALLAELVGEEGRSLVMATHSAEAAQLADVQFEVRDTRLVRRDTAGVEAPAR